MLLFSAVVYLYWRICAVCLPAPLLPRPLSSWPSLSRPSPHPLPGICLPLLLLQQCGVLCLMLCRLWRGCCHNNVEVVFCMELFTLPLRTCKVWCVSCRARLPAWWGSIADNVQSNIKGVTRCLAIHLTGLDAYTWRGSTPIATRQWGLQSLARCGAIQRSSPKLVWSVAVMAHLRGWSASLWNFGICAFAAWIWPKQANAARRKSLHLLVPFSGVSKPAESGCATIVSVRKRNGRGGVCCIYPSPGWAWTNTLFSNAVPLWWSADLLSSLGCLLTVCFL